VTVIVVPEMVSTPLQICVTVEPPVLTTTVQVVTLALPPLAMFTLAQYPPCQTLESESVAVTPFWVTASLPVSTRSVDPGGAPRQAPSRAAEETAVTPAKTADRDWNRTGTRDRIG
jgi:hypothetical protein